MGPSSLPSWRLATMCCSFGFSYTPFDLNSSGSPFNIQLEYQGPCRDLPVSFLTSSSVFAHSFISIEPYHLRFLFSFLLFFFFGHTTCGNFSPRPGIKPTPLQWKGRALTTGQPVGSHSACISIFLLNMTVSLIVP